jgi:hypothetical protein
LRDRLAQGRSEPFIAGLLAAQTAEELADYLTQTLGGEAVEEPDPVTDFTPSKRTIEPSDVDTVVAEFRAFLLDALAAGEDELPVIEFE